MFLLFACFLVVFPLLAFCFLLLFSLVCFPFFPPLVPFVWLTTKKNERRETRWTLEAKGSKRGKNQRQRARRPGRSGKNKGRRVWDVFVPPFLTFIVFILFICFSGCLFFISSSFSGGLVCMALTFWTPGLNSVAPPKKRAFTNPGFRAIGAMALFFWGKSV